MRVVLSQSVLRGLNWAPGNEEFQYRTEAPHYRLQEQQIWWRQYFQLFPNTAEAGLSAFNEFMTENGGRYCSGSFAFCCNPFKTAIYHSFVKALQVMSGDKDSVRTLIWDGTTGIGKVDVNWSEGEVSLALGFDAHRDPSYFIICGEFGQLEAILQRLGFSTATYKVEVEGVVFEDVQGLSQLKLVAELAGS